MERRIIYLTRLTRLPLLGADGAEIGRVVDAVVDLGSKPPRVNGFVVAVQRRRVFVGIGRIGEIGSDGARLRRGSVNMRQFELREGERLLAGELFGKRFKGARVVDVGLIEAPDHDGWEVATVALAGRRMPGLRRHPACGAHPTSSTGARRASCSPPSGRSTARPPSWAACTRPRWRLRSGACR